MPSRKKPGLWVMEGKWSSKVSDVRSVRPILSALDDAGQAQFADERLNRRDDLVDSLRRWGQKQHDGYPIGYLALHGSPGTVHIGGKPIDLVTLGEELPQGTLSKRVLHFGSCSVLNLSEPELDGIRRSLGVRVMTGFTKDVDWFTSLAFELLLFEALSHYKRPGDAYNYMLKTYKTFSEQVGFLMVR